MRQLMLAALPLALTAPAAALAQDMPLVTTTPTGTILEVSATGRTTRVPDLATIRAGVVSQGATAAAALADNARRMTAVLAALARAGIAAKDVQTANVSLQPQYRTDDKQPPAIIGYEARNTVAVRFRDIAKAGTVLDTLVAQGANDLDGPSLSLADPDAALDEARADAMKRAEARAQLYAKAAKLTVTRYLSINEVGENTGGTPPMMYRAAVLRAPTPIAAGQTEVTASLTVRFLLN